MDLKSIFSGIDNAKTTQRGNPLTAISEKAADGTTKHSPAEYELEIVKCEVIRAREGYDAFIASFKVLSSNNPEVKVGDSSRTWFQKLQDRDVGLGAVKAFCLAVLGIQLSDAEAVKAASGGLPDLIEKVVGKEQVFAGQTVHVRVDMIQTLKNKKDFNRHTFSPTTQAA